MPRSVAGGQRSESVNAAAAREHFANVQVARLATVSPAGHPHLVPITFALLGGDMLVTAVDHKPKRTTALQRLANLAARPDVCVLADHYSENWVQLWWARADGRARVLEPGEEETTRAAALRALIARYDQYRERPPHGAVIVIAVARWSGWSAASTDEDPR
jgi:PPOX class probable F420-dependent enzyme